MNKQWLAKGTKEWFEIIEDFEKDRVKSVWMVRDKYKVSKDLEKELNKIGLK